jgi:hypothetical protein
MPASVRSFSSEPQQSETSSIRIRFESLTPHLSNGPTMSQRNTSAPDRRTFLATSAATLAVPYFVSSKAMGAGNEVAPSEKITLGVVGMGPRCTYDMASILKLNDVQCVGVADVQASRRDAGKAMIDGHYGNNDCALYTDFRELIAREDIDAVIVATGDRWHARASMMAAEAGKDVYSEKPCGITIGDCQDLSDTFNRTKRIFQAGTQRRSVPNFQQAVQMAHGFARYHRKLTRQRLRTNA